MIRNSPSLASQRLLNYYGPAGRSRLFRWSPPIRANPRRSPSARSGKKRERGAFGGLAAVFSWINGPTKSLCVIIDPKGAGSSSSRPGHVPCASGPGLMPCASEPGLVPCTSGPRLVQQSALGSVVGAEPSSSRSSNDADLSMFDAAMREELGDDAVKHAGSSESCEECAPP